MSTIKRDLIKEKKDARETDTKERTDSYKEGKRKGDKLIRI